MPYRPLISKIRCNNPNLKKSRIQNRNHLIYIGTREGVDLSSTDIEREYSEDTENLIFNQCSSDDLYLKYIAERPGSNGLWGNVDTSNISKLGNDLSHLTSEGKNIYRGIISLSEQDAANLGFTSKRSWETYMNSVIPDVAKELGISYSTMKYVVAFHKEPDHPHCHFMLWDSSNKIASSYIHPSVQNKIREKLSGEMFKLERSQEIINKTLKRDLIIDLGKEALNEDISKLFEPPQEKIPGRFSNDEITLLSQKIISLSSFLPSHGRLNYQFLPKEIKLLVDDATDCLLNTHVIKKEYLEYMHAAEQISKTYSPSANHHSRNISTADYDIRKRISNQIINSCKKVLSIKSDFEQYTKVKIDYTKPFPFTIKYLESASQKGNSLAMNKLGSIYANKECEFYNPEKALFWFKQSLLLKPNNPDTLFKIGNFYLWSNHEFRNEDLGKQYLKESFDLGNKTAIDSLNLYNNIQQQIGISTAYSLLSRVFSCISYSKNESSIEELLIKSYSKENRKIEAQKDKEEGR